MAKSLVRELRKSGHSGRDLLGLVSQLMQAISDEDFAVDQSCGSELGAGVTAFPDEGADKSVSSGNRAVRAPTVIFRAPKSTDRALLQQWAEEPLVRSSLASCALEGVLASLDVGRQASRVAFIGCDAQSGAPFGLFSLADVDTEVEQAELTKLIGEPAFRGRGFAAAATRLLLEHGFSELGLNRIYLRTLGGNLKNIRLNERLGFRFEGVLHQGHRSEAGLRDIVLMGLLREWFESQT